MTKHGLQRAIVEHVTPEIDAGRFYIKKIPGEIIRVEANIFADGHDRYLIIDFEGEPESSITDRKIKHSPLKDVAGMIRSFHYAVCSKLYFSNETKGVDPQRLQKAADRWYKLITDSYIDAYMHTMGDISAIFGNRTELNFLLQLHLLEKAVYELGYELNGRPDWIRMPLKGIQRVLFEIEKFN